MRRLAAPILRITLVAMLSVVAFSPLAGIFLCENSVRIRPAFRPVPDARLAATLAQRTGAEWRDVETRAADGVLLKAWLFVPKKANGRAVILMHGVADSRRGVFRQTDLLAGRGYTVLAPDSRGHGVSGGEVVTYGLLEARDVRAWADWLYRNERPSALYGLGGSMGAAILIQASAVEPRLRAVVAECPFYDFNEIAYQRVSQFSGLGLETARVVFWPAVEAGLLYARLRYGVALAQASPAAALRQAKAPVLLVHGTADTNIPPRHSRMLHAAAPGVTELWEPRGATHVGAIRKAPDEFARRVLDWFAAHP